MHFLIHGEYQAKSRDFLFNLKAKFRKQQAEIVELNGEKISLKELKQSLRSQSLFQDQQVFIIENIFSRRKSKAQEEILDYLKNYQGNSVLIFWEKKSIGKVLQRRLPEGTQVKEFKTPALIFKFVEQIQPENKAQALQTLDQVLASQDPYFLMAMTIRQIKLLLMLSSGEKVGGAPWMLAKLKKQASKFESAKLFKIYDQLYFIDKKIKTGKTIMPIEWHLRQWLLEI